MTTLRCSLLAAGLALVCGVTHAESAPTPPVEIRDSTDAWKLQVNFDRQRFLGVFVTQVMHGSQHELARQTEELAVDHAVLRDEGRATLDIAVGLRALGQAPDGVYVQRVAVDAVPLTAADSIYHAQRTLYFRVEGGRAERIGIREYSAVADPVHQEQDASGRVILVHAGTAVVDTQERAPDFIRNAVRLPE